MPCMGCDRPSCQSRRDEMVLLTRNSAFAHTRCGRERERVLTAPRERDSRSLICSASRAKTRHEGEVLVVDNPIVGKLIQDPPIVSHP
jgi:hypothetical protein